MKRPWFPFYAADWLCDANVLTMTLAEQGAYIRLLAVQWREGSIPASVGAVSRMIGLHWGDQESQEVVANVLLQFEPLPGDETRLINRRLERERQEAEAISAANALNGMKGGRPKKINGEKPVAFDSVNERKANQKRTTKPNESLSQSQSQEDPEESLARRASRERVSFDFDAVYARYPNRKGKAKGLERLRALVRTQAEYEAVLLGVARYAAEVARDRVEPQFVKHFATWVNGRCWLDYAEGTPDRQAALPIAAPSRSAGQELVDRIHAREAAREAEQEGGEP